ncbi:DNA damage-regulated autophagy modulator protein 2-like [Oppia nitens]|uniref:DNA damage-regulated autophagy modulator protein 2-like n=1 Tax=Oppia nitens TaxID=1686743 RepID=UPI0023DB5302|nr:DNA damage-regulated autophagy modulator protein 2-like [Oppia nitens]
MKLNRLYLYPIAIAVLIPLLILVPYGIALYNEHIDAFLPYTSDTGALAIESGFFAQITLIIALLFAILAYLQYLQVNTIYTLSDTMIQLKTSIMKNRPKIVRFNRWSIYIAVYIVLALTSVISFRSNEFGIFHPIVCITLFVAILVFVSLKSWLSLRLSPQINSKLVAKIRIAIVVIMLISFILSLICGIWAFAVTKNSKVKHRLNWSTSDDGYIPHTISAVSQWLFVILLSPFFATYFKEMKAMTIHNGVLRITFTTKVRTTTTTTSATTKSGDKKHKNKTNQTKM